MTAPRNQCQPVNASDEALAIAAVIDPVAFHPISLGDTHPGWQHRRETATDTANKILALRAGPSDIERAFTDACDEAGCAYDNEALLQAISDLKARAHCGVQSEQEPVAWIVTWRTKHTPKVASAYLNEADAKRAAANVKSYADASDVVVIPTFAASSLTSADQS